MNQWTSVDLLRAIFSQLAPVALPELASLAADIIEPVRTGFIHSSGNYELSSQIQDAVLVSFH